MLSNANTLQDEDAQKEYKLNQGLINLGIMAEGQDVFGEI